MTGFYSQVLRKQLRERLEAAGALEQPFDLQGELALLRCLLQETLARMDGSRYRVGLVKILSKHLHDDRARAQVAHDIALLLPHGDDEYLPGILAMTNSIRRVIETIARIRNETALTVAEVRFLQIGIEGLLDEFLDIDQRRVFITRLAQLVPRSVQR